MKLVEVNLLINLISFILGSYKSTVTAINSHFYDEKKNKKMKSPRLEFSSSESALYVLGAGYATLQMILKVSFKLS